MSLAPTLTPEQAFLVNLERERHDLTWKAPRREPEPRVVPTVCRLRHETLNAREKRDRLLFNAGRYAAGARDKAAIKANQQLEKEHENETRR